MRTRFVRALLPVATVVLLAVPAGAAPGDCRLIRGAETPDDPSDDVSVCRQDVWIHQAQKPGNAAAFGVGSFPTWDTTKPTASVTSGAGAGYLSAGVIEVASGDTYDPRGVPTFEGTFTGNIDNLAATLYLFPPLRSGAVYGATYKLVIDDEVVWDTAGLVETKLSSGGHAVKKIDFAFTNIYEAMKVAGLDTDPTKTHTVRLSTAGWFYSSDAAVIVYDTSEVPSGLIFNLEPEALEAYTVIDAAPA